MAFTAEEQSLYDTLRSTLPGFFWQKATPEEIWGGLVKVFERVRMEVSTFISQSYILDAVGVWLDQHARDRGYYRQEGETDAVLRERIRNPLDVLTRPVVLYAVNAILGTEGSPTGAALVELRQARGFFQDFLEGTGDSFTGPSGSDMVLHDSAELFLSKGSVSGTVTISGATSPANNGTFPIVDAFLEGELTYTNASGVAEAFSGTWRISKQAFMSRGYRMGHSGLPGVIIVILPFWTSAPVRAAVEEALRTKKAFGFQVLVEVRRGAMPWAPTFPTQLPRRRSPALLLPAATKPLKVPP